MSQTNYEAATIGAVYAGKWIGDEPVAVSAPVEAQIATVHALLAVVDELRALRQKLSEQDGAR